MSIAEKQKIEIEYWRDSEFESPESDSIITIINKMRESAIFVDCVNRYKDKFSTAGRVLEIGAGQGWASCIYKKIFPNAYVITTDISPYSIKSLVKWEHIWNVKIDYSYACKSYETKENSSSVDLIFCFASAHHFVAHNQTLQEISRILKPNGIAYYLYEPASNKFFYNIAKMRVEKKRSNIPEDILLTNQIIEFAQKNNLNIKIDYYPTYLMRSPFETLYFYVLSRVPFLQKILPSTINFIFTKSVI